MLLSTAGWMVVLLLLRQRAEGIFRIIRGIDNSQDKKLLHVYFVLVQPFFFLKSIIIIITTVLLPFPYKLSDTFFCWLVLLLLWTKISLAGFATLW